MASLILGRWAKLYNGTKSELALEPHLAKLGRVYRFQHPVWSYGVFLDFAWPLEKVALEVDGAEHRTKAGKEKDAERTAKLERLGWTVVRCTNEEAQNEPDKVVARVKEVLDAR